MSDISSVFHAKSLRPESKKKRLYPLICCTGILWLQFWGSCRCVHLFFGGLRTFTRRKLFLKFFFAQLHFCTRKTGKGKVKVWRNSFGRFTLQFKNKNNSSTTTFIQNIYEGQVCEMKAFSCFVIPKIIAFRV